MSGGTVHMVMTTDKRIVLLGRKPRSKWWRVTCFCPKSRRRKDGSCKHERAVFESLLPEIRERAHIKPGGKCRNQTD